MPLAFDQRGWSSGSQAAFCLEDKYEVLKEIGDGSFGSVALARVRQAGSHVAKRNSLVAIKTMKKTFDSFAPCLELREVVFLRTLPENRHLVPALDIFLDPFSKKLHIAMEYMDGNLYQLMKAREHKAFDSSSVKSILFQILAGLEHIHDHDFFHRDIKPENILVSVSAQETGSTFKRYSQLMTPPATPPTYAVKLADFGLAREINSTMPYTTYVSTRWYRAPEVLLRSGQYSAPVDIWAVGAMAVEIATLKPLFPGTNEVDQVWRVCEIMGSPGNWVTKSGERVGGGKWSEGQKLSQKLGFSFPKMMPHGMDSILPAPHWSPDLRDLVLKCLRWDPNARPTTAECLRHEYFIDALDPLRPKSSRLAISRKRSELSPSQQPAPRTDPTQSIQSLSRAWFRKSLISRESAPAVPQHVPSTEDTPMAPAQPIAPIQVAAPNAPIPMAVIAPIAEPAIAGGDAVAREPLRRPFVSKRNTWAPSGAAPMPILPSIRPVSPLSNAVTARAENMSSEKSSGKVGRQLSVASHGNHYFETKHNDKAAGTPSMSPPSSHKEGFFSHLRKRARRLSGRYPAVTEDEIAAGCNPWPNQRNSMLGEGMFDYDTQSGAFVELDKALNSVRYGTEGQHQSRTVQHTASNPSLKRHHSLPQGPSGPRALPILPSQPKIRRHPSRPLLPTHQYETPDEQEELLDEALAGAQAICEKLDKEQKKTAKRSSFGAKLDLGFLDLSRRAKSDNVVGQTGHGPYPTPSPSGHHSGFSFDHTTPSVQPLPVNKQKSRPGESLYQPFPTPPDDESDWAAAAAACILASGDQWC